MSEKELSLDLSVLYRLNQKYYDKALAPYSLGYTQMTFILLVYENEGSNFNELASIGCFDKGTVTKSIAKLAEMGYVSVTNSSNDKRNKNIYTTDKAKDIVYDLYKIKNDRFKYISSNLNHEEVELLRKGIFALTTAAREKEDTDKLNNSIKFYRMDKVSFSDFQNHTSCVLYTGGCKYRCRTCINKDLIFLNETATELKYDDIFNYLETRKNLIDSVVIKGTDPLEKEGIADFIMELKSLLLKVKVETNGFNTDLIKELINEDLIDSLQIKIHSSKKNYSSFMGLNEVDLAGLNETVKFLKEQNIDYEYLITVSELMDEEGIKDIGKWLRGSKRIVLKNFELCANAVDECLKGTDEDTLSKYKSILENYVEEVKVI